MSKIEWCDSTWNPVTGCTEVSTGCANCYAKVMAKRLKAMGNARYANGFAVTLQPDALLEPTLWRKPRRVFVNSMSDLFHEDVPFEFIDKVTAVMAICQQHTFQILTKRPGLMLAYTDELRMGERLVGDALRAMGIDSFVHRLMVAQAMGHKPGGDGQPPYQALPNVWLGTSCENQETAEERIPLLAKCPAAVRFLSLEPLLGPINLHTLRHPADPDLPIWDQFIHWVIVGGESGHGARPMDLDWVRFIRDQCKADGIPIFIKQLGSVWAKANKEKGKGGKMETWPEDLRVREFPPASRVLAEATAERELTQ